MADDAISRFMPVGIVYLFEVVDIDHCQGKLFGTLYGMGKILLHIFEKIAAVIKPREKIAVGMVDDGVDILKRFDGVVDAAGELLFGERFVDIVVGAVF